MILGPKKILKLVKQINLVENLSQRELKNPEGAGLDLRLGEIYSLIDSGAFLGIDERETPKIKLVARYNRQKPQTFVFKPGNFHLITTLEKVNLPLYLTAHLKPRTTTFRSGLIIRTGNVAPGYQGKLTFALKNEGPVPVRVELGARIVHIQFYLIEGKGTQYRGQWQGGRVTTLKREKQL